MYSLAAEQDVEVEDDLARAQMRLRDLKARISSQSKKNFVLERDVRYLDSRIALLIQDRMAAEEKREVEQTLEDVRTDGDSELWPDERKMGQYANLFFLLQTEPRHVASLCRLVSLSEIDTLLQTVMFTLYGNQYEQREEHLLLTMFQVSGALVYLPKRVGVGTWMKQAMRHERTSGRIAAVTGY
jgi:Ras GTPase-activating-like protein IQGAP2/3